MSPGNYYQSGEGSGGAAAPKWDVWEYVSLAMFAHVRIAMFAHVSQGKHVQAAPDVQTSQVVKPIHKLSNLQ